MQLFGDASDSCVSISYPSVRADTISLPVLPHFVPVIHFNKTSIKHYYIKKKHNLPSKLILATLVYLLSPALSVTALKSIVIASFDGVVRTL